MWIVRWVLVVLLMATALPVYAKGKKMSEWCMGNGCVMGEWHKCRDYEANVCRTWSVEKPK